MQIALTDDGVARREGDELLVLELEHPDIGALLRDGIGLVRTAAVRKRLPLAGTRLRSPIQHPQNLVLSGLSYPEHVKEAGLAMPSGPSGLPLPGCRLDDPGSPIVIPRDDGVEVDYEGELAVVVGSSAVDVSEADAWTCIGGLTILNDVSERSQQRRAMSREPWDRASMAVSKTHPTFKPLGPWLVTIDEFDQDPDLEIRTVLNGNLVQHDRTGSMMFGLAEVVAAVSRMVRLGPGDVIGTGTPAGVGLATGRYLQAGDLVEVEIERIGALANPVESSDWRAESP